MFVSYVSSGAPNFSTGLQQTNSNACKFGNFCFQKQRAAFVLFKPNFKVVKISKGFATVCKSL